ncbi:MAG: hemerythrin domain-containing protein [Deltaproteobacteria bacterium]|nr:hemerythrin domain-containing protein [Deltaproteobacteria bacterium]
MQPRGPLMIEHRLIERMLTHFRTELQRISITGKTDPVFIDTAVDFFRMYGDRTHHGKEELILFRELSKKQMSDADKITMDELINEHSTGRIVTAELVEANRRYRNGEDSALTIIKDKLRFLADFYPKHIEKEDKIFFPSMMKYLPESEQKSMLEEFWEFDRNLIHEKYKSVVESLDK